VYVAYRLFAEFDLKIEAKAQRSFACVASGLNL